MMEYKIDPTLRDAVLPLSFDEYERLKADVLAHGVIDPIHVAPDGTILDGHHRYKIAQEIGLDGIPAFTVDPQHRLAYSIRRNFNRRNLSTEQKDALRKRQRKIAEELAGDGLTSAQIAEVLGVPGGTVDWWFRDINSLGAKETNISEARAEVSKPGRKPRVLQLKTKDKAEILERVNAGERQAQIAADLGVSQGRVAQVARAERKRIEREHTTAAPDVSIDADVGTDRARLIHGDFRQAPIPDGSVDLIFTDPPYPAEHLPLWTDLGAFARRVLGPRGLLIAYTGKIFLPEVMARLNEHMTYGWCFSLLLPGENSRIMGRHIMQGWKPILVYSTGTFPVGAWRKDVYTSPARQKDKYEWQQNATVAQEIIETWSAPDALVCDPFLGVGSFGAAAIAAGRRFVGVELDAGRFQKATEVVL